MFETYQIIIIVISIIALVLISRRFQNDSLSLGTYIGWLIIWVLVIIAALFPQISIDIAYFTGLGRGLDALYILAILILFYFLFKLYNKIEDQRKRINELVSELAIQKQEKDE